MQIEVLSTFDYASLPPTIASFVQERRSKISALLRANTYNAVEIGALLLEVKARLDYGLYCLWIEAEFPWGRSSANQFEQVAIVFGNADVQILDKFSLSALYVLAAPSTPDDVRSKALSIAATGESVSHARAKALKSGADLHTLKAGDAAPVIDEASPFYGQTVQVQSIDRKHGTARCQTDQGETNLLLSELVPPPAAPAPKSPPPPNQATVLAIDLEIEQERVGILESILRRLCVAARSGKLTDELLSEAENLLE